MADGLDSVKVKKTRRGRKRRVVGGVLVALVAVVAGLVVVSGWWAVVWSGQRVMGRDYPSYTVARGRVTYQRVPWMVAYRRVGWDVHPLPPRGWPWDWWLGWKSDYSGGKTEVWRGVVYVHAPSWNTRKDTVDVVLWPIVVVLSAGGGGLWWWGTRARRRAVEGACARCGYSMVGLAAGAVCPECGKRGGTK